jgi:hypothetical protein
MPERSNEPLIRLGRRRRRSRSALVPALVILTLGVVGAGITWYVMRSDPALDGLPPDRAAADSGGARDSLGPLDAPPLELPTLSASDAFVRDLATGLSSHPRLAAWLVTDDLVQRFVASVVSLAEGMSPVEHLEFLAPTGTFVVRDAEGRIVVDPATYQRYDLLAETFVSLDTEGSARLYRQLHPLFEEAYRELGFTEPSFDETMARAVGNLLAVQVPDAPPVVTPSGAAYAYEDPVLEERTAAQKHLLRMGPRNARRVQAKLRALADRVGIVPDTSDG